MGRTVKNASGIQWENVFPQTPTQLSLQIDQELVGQHRSLKECVAARMYGQRGGLTAVAGKLDLSPSHLCEVLAGGGDRNRKFDLDELEAYIEKFKDVTPVLYLVAKFMPDQVAQHEHVMQNLSRIVDELPSLLAQAGINRRKRTR